MALFAEVRFLRGAEIGREPEGVITLTARLPSGSTTLTEAHTTRFAPTAPPLQVTLLLDTSGSMAPYESMLRISSSTLFRLLPVGVSFVRVLTFDDKAKEVKSLTALKSADDVSSLVEWADKLPSPKGNTNVYDAFSALQVADKPHFVVLLSDGHATHGVSTEDGVLAHLAGDRLGPSLAPVIFTPVGFNTPDRLQMNLLNGLASMTDSVSHIIQSADKIPEAFGDVIGDMVGILAGNVSVVREDGVRLNKRFLQQDKLGGIHVRIDAPRHVAFRGTGQVELSFWDVLSATVKSLVVDIPDAPLEQDTDWEVHEALLFARSADLLADAKTARETVLQQLRLLGAPPRGSYVFPHAPPSHGSVLHGPGTGAGGGGGGGGCVAAGSGLDNGMLLGRSMSAAPSDPNVLTQAVDPDDSSSDSSEEESHEDDPPAKRRALQTTLDAMNEQMLAAWKTAHDSILDLEWMPIKLRLSALLSDLSCNPNCHSRKLVSLREELSAVASSDPEQDALFDGRVAGLALHLVSQRSGVTEGASMLGALDIDATHSQVAARMVSRTVSVRPDLSVDGAQNLLNNTLSAGDPDDI